MSIKLVTGALNIKDDGSYDTLDVFRGPKGNQGDPGPKGDPTTVDSALSTTSENPVQNKVITNKINSLDAGDIAYDESETYAAGSVGKGLLDYKAEINQLSESIAPVESTTTATAAHAVGELFLVGETLMVALSAIAVGDTITTEGSTPNAAVTKLTDKLLKDVQVNGTSIVNQGVANVPIMSTTAFGVAKIKANRGILIDTDGTLKTGYAGTSNCKAGSDNYLVVTPGFQHSSTFYGLAKAASDTTQSSSSNPVGTYTDAAKIAIQKMLGIYEAPWELIREDTVTNATEADIEITVDGNGQAFELTDAICIFMVPTHNEDTNIGDYGRIYLYNENTEIRRIYLLNSASKLITANSSNNMAIGRFTQNNGLINIDFYVWTSQSSRVANQIVVNPSANDVTTPIGVASPSYITKIKIGKITGQMQYRILGKRKWS